MNDQRSSTSFKAYTEGLFRAQAEDLDIFKENDEKLLRVSIMSINFKQYLDENKSYCCNILNILY